MLVTFGVLIGKVNPLQLLVLGFIETVLFVMNCYIGYTVLGVVDVGEAELSLLRYPIIMIMNDLLKLLSFMIVIHDH